MNDVLRPQLLSSVVFNVQCNNLDLSLLETLAREADLDHISNDSAPANCVAHLVRKLTIYALNPLYPVKVFSFIIAEGLAGLTPTR